MPDFLFEPTPYREAADFILDKPLLAQGSFQELLPDLRSSAFTVARITGLDQLQRIQSAAAALPLGGDWDTQRQLIAAELAEAYEGPAAATKAEHILRQQAFQAYGALNARALNDTIDLFPYRRYETIGDASVRSRHRCLAGIIAPSDSPFWGTHTGPWEPGCRCDVVGLMETEVTGIRSSEKKTPAYARTVMERESPALKHLEEGQLIGRTVNKAGKLLMGPDHAISVAPNANFTFHPLRPSLSTLREKYREAPECWQAFEQWARAQTPEGSTQTIWEWLESAPH
jgi:SPP1 gp7 family putative phage head morphogenesis protein